jgi:hypothetical protein
VYEYRRDVYTSQRLFGEGHTPYKEQVHHCRYATRKEAIQDITEYIEFSITGKENRPDSVFYLPPRLNDGSMKNDWQHKRFGVHY